MSWVTIGITIKIKEIMLITLALIPFAVIGIVVLFYVGIIILVLIFGIYEKISSLFRKKRDWNEYLNNK